MAKRTKCHFNCTDALPSKYKMRRLVGRNTESTAGFPKELGLKMFPHCKPWRQVLPVSCSSGFCPNQGIFVPLVACNEEPVKSDMKFRPVGKRKCRLHTDRGHPAVRRKREKKVSYPWTDVSSFYHLTFESYMLRKIIDNRDTFKTKISIHPLPIYVHSTGNCFHVILF